MSRVRGSWGGRLRKEDLRSLILVRIIPKEHIPRFWLC